MLTLTIQADDPADLRAQLAALLGTSAAVAAATPAASADPKPATRSSKKSEPASTAGANSTAGSADTAPTATTSLSEGMPATRETVTPLCNEYGVKAGASALQEIFKELGSPQGKFTGVPDDKLTALQVRLTDLLAA